MEANTLHIINVAIRPFEDKNIISNLLKIPSYESMPQGWIWFLLNALDVSGLFKRKDRINGTMC